MTIERHHGRIWFGEGQERWSVTDPHVHGDDWQITPAFLRASVSDWMYLLCTCPSTKLACEKLALIRRALRTVPNPYDEKAATNG